ncbi:alkene reductase, partial [bacterium]|nr:alkene reductase [bacterium]
LQLWHCGRVAHSFFSETQPIAPSSLAISGRVPRTKDLQYEVPKTLDLKEIQELVQDYKSAAKNAIEAGFDGVEIHAANGYLIDQFLHYNSNQRSDQYGDSPENMSRFALEVLQAIIEELGADKVGIRLSPAAYFNMETDSKDPEVFKYLLNQINALNIAYVHSGIFDDKVTYDYLEGSVTSFLRSNYQGTIIGAGGYTKDEANQDLAENKMDLIAFGRPFIANPNLVELIREDQEITAYNETMLMQLV